MPILHRGLTMDHFIFTGKSESVRLSDTVVDQPTDLLGGGCTESNNPHISKLPNSIDALVDDRIRVTAHDSIILIYNDNPILSSIKVVVIHSVDIDVEVYLDKFLCRLISKQNCRLNNRNSLLLHAVILGNDCLNPSLTCSCRYSHYLKLVALGDNYWSYQGLILTMPILLTSLTDCLRDFHYMIIAHWARGILSMSWVELLNLFLTYFLRVLVFLAAILQCQLFPLWRVLVKALLYSIRA